MEGEIGDNIILYRCNLTFKSKKKEIIFEVPQVQANKFSHNENILLKTIIKIL